MIYFYEFLKGGALALMLFATFYLFALKQSFFYAFFGLLPGLFLFIIAFLLIENEELKQKLRS